MERIKAARELVSRVEPLFCDEVITQFTVLGRTRDYLVTCNSYGVWTCSCEDHQYRHATCKHITACILKINEKEEL